ncbi:MAG: CBS domain-containing protein [Planctomycetota bacterium]
MKSIGELLSGQHVHTLAQSSTVLDAARLMQEAHIGAILVTGEREKLVGIFTERDLMSRVVVAGHDPGTLLLEEVMTRGLVTSTPERRVTEAAQEMQDRHIRHLPVVEDGQVVGILSLRDLLRAHLEAKVQEVDHLTAYIQGDES